MNKHHPSHPFSGPLPSFAGRPRMLKLGCGATFHPDWINVDFQARGNEVLGCSL